MVKVLILLGRRVVEVASTGRLVVGEIGSIVGLDPDNVLVVVNGKDYCGSRLYRRGR